MSIGKIGIKIILDINFLPCILSSCSINKGNNNMSKCRTDKAKMKWIREIVNEHGINIESHGGAMYNKEHKNSLYDFIVLDDCKEKWLIDSIYLDSPDGLQWSSSGSCLQKIPFYYEEGFGSISKTKVKSTFIKELYKTLYEEFHGQYTKRNPVFIPWTQEQKDQRDGVE